MYAGYFNYRFFSAEGRWQRRDFSRRWWTLYRHDPRWVPPDWRVWAQIFHARTWHPHLARMDPILLSGEALPRRARPQRHVGVGDMPALTSGALFEVTVAAGVLLVDPRRTDRLAYAALLHVANDRESLTRFLTQAQDYLAPQGIQGLILPTGLSPHLGSGVLQAPFDVLPPPHTPYGPPYIPELFQVTCRPLARAQLYHVRLPQEGRENEGAVHASVSGPARVTPLPSAASWTTYLPLFQAAASAWSHFPPPDELEIDFWRVWLSQERVWGWVAWWQDEPVGLALVQADRGWALHRAWGGRGWWRRVWLAWLARRRAVRGHVLWLGVLPAHRGRGIGRQLWHQVMAHARSQGWRQLSVGPVSTRGPGPAFLARMGAHPLQSYLLHRVDWG